MARKTEEVEITAEEQAQIDKLVAYLQACVDGIDNVVAVTKSLHKVFPNAIVERAKALREDIVACIERTGIIDVSGGDDGD